MLHLVNILNIIIFLVKQLAAYLPIKYKYKQTQLINKIYGDEFHVNKLFL